MLHIETSSSVKLAPDAVMLTLVKTALLDPKALNAFFNYGSFQQARLLVVELLRNKISFADIFQLIEQINIEPDEKYDQAAIDAAINSVKEFVKGIESYFLCSIDVARRYAEEIYKLDQAQLQHDIYDFCMAYHFGNDEQLCIDLISDNPDIQKIQLQFVLGVLAHSPGRMVGDHDNKYFKLQAALINKVKDTTFLSSLLRDFIIRPCDGGQIPCKDASVTIKLLVDAGADPYADHLDIAYLSPGFLYVNLWSGNPITDELNMWAGAHQRPELPKMIAAIKPNHFPESATTLFRNIMFNFEDGGGRDYNINRVNSMVKELITRHRVTTENLPALIQQVENQFQQMHEIAFNQNNRDRLPEKFRAAQAKIMERIYYNEHKQEQRLLKNILWSLIGIPLVLPLIYTFIMIGKRAKLLKETKFTVTTEDVSEKVFAKKLETKHQIKKGDSLDPLMKLYSQRSPVKNDKENAGETKLRKAVVFGQRKWYSARIAQLGSIFSGTVPAETIRKDVKVYRAVKSI